MSRDVTPLQVKSSDELPRSTKWRFEKGNPKTRKPETGNRKPESGIRNRNPESEPETRNRNPESGIRNPQIKENKFFKFAKII